MKVKKYGLRFLIWAEVRQLEAVIKTLRPYFSIFSITVVRICLRKQQSKFFTNMLTTPSIEHVNIWFDSASPCHRLPNARLITYFCKFVFLQNYQNTKNRLRDFHFHVFPFCILQGKTGKTKI